MIEQHIASAIKTLGFPVIILAVSSIKGINEFSVPLIGVPLTVVTMAAAGAMCAFAWPRAESSRPRLFAVTLASTFVGASCVTVIPAWVGAEWPKELQGPLAFIFGLLAPWVVPAVRTAVPTFVRGLANMIIRAIATKAAVDSDEPEVYVPKKRKSDTEGED